MNKITEQLIFYLWMLLLITYSPTIESLTDHDLKKDDPTLIKQHINNILKQPEFQTTREEYHWRYIPNQESVPVSTNETTNEATNPSQPNYAWHNLWSSLAQLLELLLWLSIGLAITIIARYAPRWLEKYHHHPPSTPIYTATVRLLNQDSHPSTALSTHLSQQAWQFWQQGQTEMAINLLYRGALAGLSQREGLTISDGTTDDECVGLLSHHSPAIELTLYCSKLIQTWQQVAYAQRFPSDSEVHWLCEEWQRYFG